MLSWPPAFLAALTTEAQRSWRARLFGQQRLDHLIREFTGQAVGTEQEQVARLGFELEHIRRHLVLRAQRAGNHILQRGA